VKIDQQTVDSTCLLTLAGNLDSFSVATLKERMDRQFEAGVHSFIIDLSGVEFMDSAGLGQLVAALKISSSHGGDVILVGANKGVRDLLRMTRLDTIFRCLETIEQAQNALKAPSPES
jgi:anti-sigma B factor antagonist